MKIKINETQLQEIQEKVDAEVAAYILGLPGLIKSKLNEVVAKCLGFDNRWSHKSWEVDHCNGRMSAVSNYVGSKAKQIVKDLVEEIGNDFNPDAEIRNAIQKEFRKQFDYLMRREVREMIESRVKQIAAQEIAKIEVDFGKIEIGAPDPKKAADPNYGQTGIEKVNLDILLEENSDE